MDEQAPLDLLPRNDKYAVIIRNGVFGWDRLENKEGDEEQEEIKLNGKKAIENGPAKNNNAPKVAFTKKREVSMQVS